MQDVELVDVSESAAELHEDAQHLILLKPAHAPALAVRRTVAPCRP